MNNYYGTFTLRMMQIVLVLGLLPMLSAGIAGTSNGVAYGAWSANAFGAAFLFTVLLGFFLLPVYVLVAFLLVWFWTKIAGRYWLNTKQARAIWPELEGYKLYLKTVDIDNIQFESAEGSAVTRTMPYALVFGLDTKWQQRLDARKSN